MQKLKVKLDPGAITPKRAHKCDAGLDIFTPIDFTIPADSWISIDTGVHIAIPEGYFGLLTSKSGIMRSRGIKCTGTIDSGYTGAIGAVLFNESGEEAKFYAGDKVTQLVILKCETPDVVIVEELDETERGDGGFGSTGR